MYCDDREGSELQPRRISSFEILRCEVKSEMPDCSVLSKSLSSFGRLNGSISISQGRPAGVCFSASEFCSNMPGSYRDLVPSAGFRYVQYDVLASRPSTVAQWLSSVLRINSLARFPKMASRIVLVSMTRVRSPGV